MATVEVKSEEAATRNAESAELVDTLAAHYDAPEWLVGYRRRAWKAYRATSLPDRIAHLWRYTDPGQFEPPTDKIVPAMSSGSLAESRKLWEAEELAGIALWQGGQIAHLELDARLRDAGVLLMDLHAASREYQRLVEAHLGRAIKDACGKFETLNCALWQAGIFLHVPRHVTIDKPIHLVVSGEGVPRLLATRLLIGLEEAAQATVVNEFVSPRGEDLAANTVVEAQVAQAANLRLIGVQRWGDRVVSHFSQRALLARDAQLLAVWAGLGAKVSKVDLGARLDGRGAHAKFLGMSFGQRGQHFDHHTVHDHQASDTYSDLDFKIVLKDQARSAYTGLIRIEPHATNCEAYQENRNLLLSNGTRADTIPELEILNDEVRCSHGATIGPLDDQELFYLESRGIPRDEAIRMVVTGFVEPTLRAVPVDLQERLRSYVVERVKEI